MGIDGAEVKRSKEDSQPASKQNERNDEEQPQPRPRSKLLLFVIVVLSACLGYFGREYLPYLKNLMPANDKPPTTADSTQPVAKTSDDVPKNFIYTSIYSGKTRGEIESACRQSWSGTDVAKCVEDNVRMRKLELYNKEKEIGADIERRERELKKQLTSMVEEYESICRKENLRGSKEFYKCMEWADKQRAELSSR